MSEKDPPFWKDKILRRPRAFPTPDDLLNAAYGYFQWCDDHPWYKTDFKGKDAERVEIPTQRPYTIAGFCVHVGRSRHWWNELRKASDGEYLEVLTHIEDIMTTNKFEGATVGAYNPMIIARDLGLKEGIEANLTDNRKTVDELFPKDDEI